MKKGYAFCLSLLVFLSGITVIAQTATIKEEKLVLDTYLFDDPNPVPILKDNPKIYPYYKFESYRHKSQKKEWKVVTLENDYIKVFVLPEIGGKVWGAIEKSTGGEFLYKNEVIKFRNIAMRGPWTSGGIEFNFGIIGHHPSTATAVDYITKDNGDGSVSCIVGNLDLPSRTTWRVEIKLEKDKAYFETNASWYNPTPVNQSYYNWMTAAAVATDDLEFFIPGDEYLKHNGDALPWPIDSENRNLAYYKDNNFGPAKSYHIVGDYKDFFGGYYHNSNFGFGHWSPYEEMPGQKLWLWALSRSGGIWEDLLTDTDGQYIEFQAGRLFNQYFPGAVNPISQANFEPYVMDRWREIWFPIKEIGGMEAANEWGVLNVEQENGQLNIGINALQQITEELQIVVNGKLMHSEPLALKTMEVFTKTAQAKATDTIEVSFGNGKLYYTNIAEKTLIKRSFHQDPNLQISEAQQLFMKGWEAMKYRVYDEALDTFTKLVELDPSYQQAWAKLAELEYKRTNYDNALEYANKALKMDTYNPEANYMAGIIYRAKMDHINALESFGWAARDMKYRSVSYAQMAEVYTKMKNFKRAKEYADKALNYNAHNVNAKEIELLLSRLEGDEGSVTMLSEELLELDPLNLFVAAEKYLWTNKDEDREGVSKIQNEFRAETILELALQYYNLGRREEALKILDLNSENTKIKLWRTYLLKDSDAAASSTLLSEATKASPNFVLPYRTETLPVLEWAQSQDPSWKLKYYLAQNYLAVGLKDKGVEQLKAVGDLANSDVFYRFRARFLDDQPYELRLKDYQKALELNDKDWKAWEEFIQFNLNNKKYDAAYTLSRKAYKRFSENYNLGLSHAKAALQLNRYAECIEVLKKINILPFEHASESKNIYNEAHVFLAYELMQKKKYSEASKLLIQSKEWPENLGVGKPYDVDSRLQDFLLSHCLEELGKTEEAKILLESVATYTRDHLSTSNLNNLFGLLSLKKLGKGNEVTNLLSRLKNAEEGNDRNNLVIAFLENDTQQLTQLKQKNNIDESLWNIMDAAVMY